MYDLAIIGGGPGGYVAAITGAQKGLKVLLIERDTLGGNCLARGCIPTKSLYYDSKLFKAARSSPVLTGTETLSIDPRKMKARKQQLVQTLSSGIASVIGSNGIKIAAGTGQLISPGRLRMVAQDGTISLYEAHNIILATGSRPAVPSFIEVDGHLVQTTDEALDAEDIPRNVIIIGGGVIGLEMAAIYLNLGAQVTIIEMLPDIILTEDHDIRRAMRQLLAREGAAVFLKATVQEAVRQDKRVAVRFKDEIGGIHTLHADRLLMATGRAPVLDGIEPDRLGLAMQDGFVKVNHRFETSLGGVYAIGDVVGGMMLAHKASAEAEAAVANISGTDKKIRPEWIPRCIWGLAEIGAAGLTEAQARQTGRNIKIGKFPHSASGAATALGNPDGFTKIIGDADTGEILGVHIFGEHATDLISEPVSAMTMESAVEDLYEAVKPHPTLSETVGEAARAWNNLAIHLPASGTQKKER
ncbi:MAG: dihydrolipoyl dehydrogenase [Desulfobacterales bacterium]|nr:MAG: dihydrolipoyl dehydrogenase [Desulfobacterales bacterium]